MANPVAWFEIMGPDPEQASKFYSELFGWQTQTLEGGYTTVDTLGGGGINGGFGKSDDGKPSVKVYVLVDDLQAALDKAGTLGGSTVLPITEMSVVTFALFSDPAGNV